MKRLMLMLVTTFAAAIVSQATFAQHNEAQKAPSRGKRIPPNQEVQSQGLSYPAGPGENPKEYPASILAYAQPFMPKDTMRGVGWMIGKRCDQNGNFAENGSAMCMIYVAHSVSKTYVFRPSEQEGDRYFILVNGRPESYVHFNGGRYTKTIASMSPAAEQFASANGYKLNPKDKTMVSTGGEGPTPQRTINCKDSNIGLGERIACAGGTANTGTASATDKPAAPPVAAQAPDCSKLSVLQRIKCEAAVAAGK